MRPDLAVIILTLNEEVNLPFCLQSVCGWASEVFVVDSFSIDHTPEIAALYDCHFRQHAFTGYADQRTWALTQLPIRSSWIFFLDADEVVSDELKEEVQLRLADPDGFVACELRFRLIWMEKWIRRGYYGVWLRRIFRKGRGQYESRQVNEHLLVDGKIARLSSDLIHHDRKPLSDWIVKHNKYAEMEARAMIEADWRPGHVEAAFNGPQFQRKRWLKQRIYERLPPLLRPWIYFLYRLFLCGGIFDGKEAYIYHFLQALWFQHLIDIKYIEMKRPTKAALEESSSPRDSF